MNPPGGRGGPASDDHLSIGEVLAELQDEFPDVTISKIRFLESQGLIDPERTPSGYRKFHTADLARLRFVLYQQKEHFLPLKVIKERLDELGPDELADPRHLDAPAPASERPAPPVDATAPARGPRPEPRRRPAFAATLPPEARDADEEVGAPAPAVEALYSRDTLCDAAGVDAEQLASLEQFGLVRPAREAGDEVQFDADALETATLAAGFFARGLEARHLRMYRTAAEREALLYAQVLLPYLRQRNPEARARLQQELVELAGLGRRLRLVLLREAVRETLTE